MTEEVALQKAIADRERQEKEKSNWFSKAVGMVNTFMKTTFFSKRSILTMLDEDGGLKHHLGRKLRCCMTVGSSVSKAVRRMQQLRFGVVFGVLFVLKVVCGLLKVVC